MNQQGSIRSGFMVVRANTPFGGGRNMIIVSASFTAKPGMRDAIAEISRKAVELTRQEKGNISYTLFKSSDDDVTMMYFEEWESLDDLRAHLKTDHIREAREARKDMLEGTVRVRVFESKEVEL
jgi:quinol monooxygenase YgiN